MIQRLALPLLLRRLPLLVILGLPISSVADEPENTVIVAFDFSSSYFNEDRFKKIRRNFQKLAKIVQSPALRHPTIFQVIQIGNMSQGQEQCPQLIHPSSTVLRLGGVRKPRRQHTRYSYQYSRIEELMVRNSWSQFNFSLTVSV